MSFTTHTEREFLRLLLLAKNPIAGTPRVTDMLGDDKLYLGMHIGAKINEASGAVPVIVEPSNGLNLSTFLGNANAVDDDTNYYRLPLDNALGTSGGEIEMFSEAAIDAHEEDALSNSSLIQYGQASSNWGTIFSWFITNTPDLSQPHTGIIRAYGHLTIPLPINVNNNAFFAVGTLALIIK